MNLSCPVCKQGGLPDYKKVHTICPQCNSDLQPYLLLENIQNDTQQNKRMMWIGIAALSGISVLAVFFYWRISSEDKQLLVVSKDKPAVRDSVKASPSVTPMPAEIPIIPAPDSLFTFTYIVKSGDYPAKIARIFYDDWQMYKKIEADNNLQQPYILKAGQSLLIKLHR